MAMERFTISMTSHDVDLLERGRADLGMNMSAYIRLLIAEHEERVPAFIQYKDLITKMSEINNSMKEIIISQQLSDQDKLHLFEKMDELKKMLKQKMQ